jgi:hypothetical protein
MLSSYLALVCLAWRLGMASVHAFQPVNAVSSTLLQSFETTTSYRSPSPTTASSRSNAIGMSSMTSVDYRATYNFGPASSRDTIVYSAERPGNDPDSKTTRVNNEQVMDWIKFMKNQGVTNVIVLLDENEFDIYDYPGLLSIYEQHGIRYLRQSMDEANASKTIYSFVKNVKNMGGKVVTHCTVVLAAAVVLLLAGWCANMDSHRNKPQWKR